MADSGPSPRFAHKPLWLFIGSLDAPAANGHVTLHIANGNLRALRAMLGQPLDQSFSYDRHTDLRPLARAGAHADLAEPAQVGDRISVRIRAPRHSSLGQVEQVPANHVGDHEPGR